MSSKKILLASQAAVLLLAVAGLFMDSMPCSAQAVQHLGITQPGGMPGVPVMTGIQRLTNGVSVTWYGPHGYSQLFQTPGLEHLAWQPVGGLTLGSQATVPVHSGNAFFGVSGPPPQYAGAEACAECHQNTHDTVVHTAHIGAFTNTQFAAQGGQTNSSCLPCHTVGYGLPTGFVSRDDPNTNTRLAGVQCENCHGPAGNHAAVPDDFTAIPRVDLAATVCGGCHTGANQPTFDEWKTSGHAAVVPDALQVMSSASANISSCGRCHSGSVRIALIKGQDPAATVPNDLDVAVTCAVCHDPHQVTPNPVQLRNPVNSTNDFFLTTSDDFSAKYNANTDINLCAQCHNHRGAAWNDTDRAPHHSPQYNLLIGTIGELTNGSATFNPGTHAGLPSSAVNSYSGTFYLTNQCVGCHMQDDAPPATTQSHTFTVAKDYAVCMNCHLIFPGFDPFQDLMVPAVSNRVFQLKLRLDAWANSPNADPSLRTNGALAWEYTTPGGLILQTNRAGTVTGWVQVDSVNFKGPNAGAQVLIPDYIKRVRFNLYLVLNDGSYGLHNPNFAINLLDTALYWLQ